MLDLYFVPMCQKIWPRILEPLCLFKTTLLDYYNSHSKVFKITNNHYRIIVESKFGLNHFSHMNYDFFTGIITKIDMVTTAWKLSKYGVFSGPFFPVFGLNTKRYSVSRRIQSECGKIQTRKNSVFGHCSRSKLLFIFWFRDLKLKRYLLSFLLRTNFDFGGPQSFISDLILSKRCKKMHA